MSIDDAINSMQRSSKTGCTSIEPLRINKIFDKLSIRIIPNFDSVTLVS